MKLDGSASMSGFNNYSTDKKEDVSTKLRAQNLRKTKEQTKKLEDESRKMEERLMELKLAMNREKEDRERQGGGFWSRGQSGSLNSYATDVLNKPGPKQPKVQDGKKKVKVLKNSALDIPERPNQPGTMAFIASQEYSGTPRAHKVKATRCGQCEEKKAAVSCVQCSEVYCATCFTAFHLKGALKKHRSIPLSASGPRVCMSPRPGATPTNRSLDIHEQIPPMEPIADRQVLVVRQSHHDRNGPEGASRSFDGPSLLSGEYNEAENAAAFQQALKEWRTGNSNNQSSASMNGEVKMSSEVKVEQSPRRAYSPVKTPTVPVDAGTGTETQKKELEIKFHSSMTYAERLLLKKHRRTEVEGLFTPRSGDQNGEVNDDEDFLPRAITPHIHPPCMPPTPRNDPWLKEAATPRVEPMFQSEKTMDSQEFKEQRINFKALYDIATYNDPSQTPCENEGDLAIEEVDDNSPKKSNEYMEETSACLVQEMDVPNSYEVLDVSKKKKNQSPKVKSSIDHQSKEKSSSVDRPNVQSHPPSAKKRPLSSKQKENTKTEESTEKSKTKSSAKSRPSTAKSRPPTAKSRPVSTVKSRPQSRYDSTSRPSSRSKSRAWSRMEGEGILTKAPSQGLKEVAMMDVTNSNKPQSYSSAFGDFFTFGVKAEQTERVIIPTKHKDSENKVEKHKVSSMLYQMAPRSWRPDSSLADNVPEQDLTVDNVSAPLEAAEPMDVEDQPSFVLMRKGTPSDHQHVVAALGQKMAFDDGFNLGESDDEIELNDDDDLDDLPVSSHKTPRSGSVLARPDSGTPRPSSNVSHHQGNRPVSSTARQSSSLGHHRGNQPLSGTPRQSSNLGHLQDIQPSSITPRPSSKVGRQEGSRPSSVISVHSQAEKRPSSRRFMTPRPESRKQSFIVVDGEDLSRYDDVGKVEEGDKEDEETLNNLEWELASETGRLTADGKVSKMSMIEDSDEFHSSDSEESMRSFSRMNQQDQGYDINSRLREDELDDNESDEETDYADVQALH